MSGVQLRDSFTGPCEANNSGCAEEVFVVADGSIMTVLF
jgi:hypothetical protein